MKNSQERIRKKIVHLCCLVTPNGDFGGPIQVAIQQISSLNRQDFRVQLLAGGANFSHVPRDIQGVPCSLHRVFGLKKIAGKRFITLIAPGILLWLIRERRAISILHIHLGRDFITTLGGIVAIMLKIPYIVQTHGMINVRSNWITKLYDMFFTVRILRNAKRVLILTSDEEKELKCITSRQLRILRFPNGTQIKPLDEKYANHPKKVLFVGRLHSGKRPELFVRNGLKVCDAVDDVTFHLYGDDQGEREKLEEMLRRAAHGDRFFIHGAVPHEVLMSQLATAYLLILPTAHDVFPMAIVEAMALGVPVITTQKCQSAYLLEESNGGYVVDENPNNLLAATNSIIQNPLLRNELGNNARNYAIQQLDIDSLISKLRSEYELYGR